MSEAPESLQPTPKLKIYLESRYRKLERGLPQTIFYCPECKGNRRRAKKCTRCGGFGKLTKDSVQELLARCILPAFQSRHGKFHGAGREDLDVLMLGSGRPFIFEIVGARNSDVDLASLDARIAAACAGRVELQPFERVTRERVKYWKEGHFSKVYRVRVQVAVPVDRTSVEALVGQDLEIVQRTPTRVAHRRADLERARRVTVVAARDMEDREFVLDLQCMHGTYVKEWISGDGGRTKPSLGDLLSVPCECSQLDVLDILTSPSLPSTPGP